MSSLHNHDPPIIHGHLNPSNIFFDIKFNILIGDIGFNSLKKIGSIIIGYSNKNAFTAPE